MATTSPSGTPVPSAGDAPNVPADMLAMATFLDARTIPRFGTAANRDAAIPAPIAKQRCVIAGLEYVYDNGAWRVYDFAWFNASVDIPQGATYNSGAWTLNASESITPTAAANGLAIALPANSIVSISCKFYCPGGIGGSVFRIQRSSDAYVLAALNPSTILGDVWHLAIPALNTNNYPAITTAIYNNHGSARHIDTELIVNRKL